jgi:hypothetical protein
LKKPTWRSSSVDFINQFKLRQGGPVFHSAAKRSDIMRDVLVTENIVGSEMESLKGRFDVAFEPEIWSTPDRLQEMIVDFRAIVVRNQTRVTSELIASAPHLQVIGRAGAGLDNIDLDAASSAGIVVAYTPEQNAVSVAELTIGMMLALGIGGAWSYWISRGCKGQGLWHGCGGL